MEHQSGISSKLEAYKLARQKYEQKRKLVDAGTISREELAQARSEMASSKYAYEKAVAAKAKSRIVTPISGIVVSLTKLVDGAMVSSGEKIATIMDYSKAKIVLDVTSSDIPTSARIATQSVVNPKNARTRKTALTPKDRMTFCTISRRAKRASRTANGSA